MLRAPNNSLKQSHFVRSQEEMPHYSVSRSYPVLSARHAKIMRRAASLARQPTVLLNDQSIWDFSEDGPLSDTNFPEEAEVILLNDNEHVLTITKQFSSVQISQQYQNVAIECAAIGWLAVKL